ncbi:MAG: hypothetical protein RCG15_06150 [Candidatus Rickettsia vulgarisii]
MFPQLEELNMSCLEEGKILKLPKELSNLKNLQKLNIDNGNGCSMNVRLPENISDLKTLREIVLYGALDNRNIDNSKVSKEEANVLFPASINQMTWITH